MNELTQTENDGLPVAVATDILTGKLRTTNRLRKNCRAAREKIFVSTATPKSSQERFQLKLAKANYKQLVTWQKRWRRKGDRLQDALFDAEQKNDVAACEGLRAVIAAANLYSINIHNEIVKRVKNSGDKI